MQRLLGLSLALSLVLSCFHSLEAQETKTYSIDQGLRLFVAGHSFCVPAAEVVTRIAQSAGLKNHTLVGDQYLGGSSVTQHWQVYEPQNKAKQALKTGQIDILELSPNKLIPDPAIASFVDFALKYNPNIRVLIQESWGPYSLTESPHGNPPAPDGEAATYEALMALHAIYYATLENQITSINTSVNKQVAFVIPTGRALFTLRDKVHQGLVPGIKTQAELFRDRLGHPTPPVLLLNAYCHFAVIYRRSPIGLPMPAGTLQTGFSKADGEALNLLLQQLAWQAVIANPLSGVQGTPDPSVPIK